MGLGIPWPALRGPLRNHFWKKRRPQPYWGGDNSGNALEASNALNDRVWGIPAVLSRRIPGHALRVFPGSFRNFSGISSGKSQPYWGCGPNFLLAWKFHPRATRESSVCSNSVRVFLFKRFFFKVARLQSEFCTKDFLLSYEFSYEKCSESSPEIFEPLFRKNPAKFLPNFPPNFQISLRKIKKKSPASFCRSAGRSFFL